VIRMLAYGGDRDGGGPPIVDIYACRADADGTVYFRTHGCFPGDSIAVARCALTDRGPQRAPF
jgi:hypothetical protein